MGRVWPMFGSLRVGVVRRLDCSFRGLGIESDDSSKPRSHTISRQSQTDGTAGGGGRVSRAIEGIL